MRDADDLRGAVNDLAAYLEEHTGKVTPPDRGRIALLELVAEHTHILRREPATVETEKGVKANPGMTALLGFIARGQSLLKDLDGPVVAIRAAKAAAKQAEGEKLTPSQVVADETREALRGYVAN